MYKLLTTAAVIMTVATPSIAWEGAKELTQKLDGIYGHLDGGAQFNTLQGVYEDNTPAGGAATTGKNGQLSNFFDTVDKGVTYITLTVDGNNNIQPDIKPGVAFSTIETAKNDLVNRINYDLFSDTDQGNYVEGTDYTDVKNQGLTITGTPEDAAGENDYVTNQNGGLAGVKINTLVTNTNTINDYLVAGTTNETANLQFQADFGNKTGSVTFIADPDDLTKNKTVDLSTGFFGQIDSLNAATNIASNAVIDAEGNVTSTGSFFEGIDLTGTTAETINNFAIPSYNAYNDIGNANLGHNSISDWANGVYQYATANTGTGSFTDTTGGEVSIDVAGNTVTYGGTTYNVSATDGTLTPQ